MAGYTSSVQEIIPRFILQIKKSIDINTDNK